MPKTGNRPQEFTLERIYERVEIQPSEDGCHLWVGHTVSGYGQIKARGQHKYVHVVANELRHGPLLPGQCVLHRCDVRNCVRDSHHWRGTKAENNADKAHKGRAPATRPMLGKHFNEKSRAQMSSARWQNNFAAICWAFNAPFEGE